MDFALGKKIKNKSLFNKTEKKEPVEDTVSLSTLMLEKKFEEALKHHESVINKESTADWYTKGYLLGKLNKIEAPIECYDKAISLDDQYVKAWYRKGQCFLKLKKFLESAECFEKVLELEEQNVKNKKDDQWSAAAVLFLMISYISEYNKLNAEDKLTPQVKESTDLWKDKCYDFFKKNNLISESASESEFLHNSIENFDDLLKYFEPTLAEEFGGKSYKRFGLTKRNKIIIGACIGAAAIILIIRLIVLQQPLFSGN